MSLVANLFDLFLARLPRATRDRALDIILRHVELARFFNRHLQAVVRFGVRRPALRRENDLFAELGKERPALRVDLALLQLNIVPLGMPRHRTPWLLPCPTNSRLGGSEKRYGASRNVRLFRPSQDANFKTS